MKNLTLPLSLLVGAALTIPSLAMAVESADMQTETANSAMEAEVAGADNTLQTEAESDDVYQSEVESDDMAEDESADDVSEAEDDIDGTVDETVVEEEVAQPYS